VGKLHTSSRRSAVDLDVLHSYCCPCVNSTVMHPVIHSTCKFIWNVLIWEWVVFLHVTLLQGCRKWRALVCNPRLRCSGKECGPAAALRKQRAPNASRKTAECASRILSWPRCSVAAHLELVVGTFTSAELHDSRAEGVVFLNVLWSLFLCRTQNYRAPNNQTATMIH